MAGQPLYDLDHPLSSDEEEAYQNALSKLQGNILKSHGREAAKHVFLKFQDGKADQVKQFLSAFACTLTSAYEQRLQTYRDPNGGELLTALYLSAEGYRYLGQKEKGEFSDEFWQGMSDRATLLGDPRDNPFAKVHAMALFAHNSQEVLDKQVEWLSRRTSSFASMVTELGTTKKNAGEKVIEHFGYVDGISQPLFYKSDFMGVTTNNWNPGAGPKLVLVKDPYGASDNDCGSYLVFRKLEQNVQGFSDRVKALADTVAQGDQDRAGAMILGRYQNGNAAISPGQPGNDFTYQEDEQGKKCPFFAHIRKTNPRGQTGKADEKDHRIVRRGITYGNDGDSAVGLLFQCCQANLVDQFEFLQSLWANNAEFPNANPATGKDPIIGQSSNGQFTPLAFPDSGSNPGTTPFNFQGFVTLKGGEYFFAPSIGFLKSLA